MECNHEALIIDGGSMARRTDSRGRPCLVCQVCYFNPADTPRRERGGNDMFSAIAENTAPAPEWKPVDVLADFDDDGDDDGGGDGLASGTRARR